MERWSSLCPSSVRRLLLMDTLSNLSSIKLFKGSNLVFEHSGVAVDFLLQALLKMSCVPARLQLLGMDYDGTTDAEWARHCDKLDCEDWFETCECCALITYNWTAQSFVLHLFEGIQYLHNYFSDVPASSVPAIPYAYYCLVGTNYAWLEIVLETVVQLRGLQHANIRMMFDTHRRSEQLNASKNSTSGGPSGKCWPEKGTEQNR